MVYLVANWKSHKTLSQALAWVDAITTKDTQATVIVCPPFPYFSDVAKKMKVQVPTWKVGVQDISPFPFGKYTGAVSAAMVAEEADYAIVGHSERRRYFHETSKEVARKAAEAIDAGMTPIVCVDEPYAEEQMNEIAKEHGKRILVAYEPLAAIGSGKPDTPEHALSVRRVVMEALGEEVPFLYGGSVTAENFGSFVVQDGIDGALVGGASLEASDWQDLVNIVSD